MKNDKGLYQDMRNKKLSIIIPVRENGSIGVVERLNRRSTLTLDDVEFIVVDDGSSSEYAQSIEQATRELGGAYLYLNSSDAPFSLSRARNKGIREARGKFLYFEDVDFLGARDFYQNLIKASGYFEKIPLNFISIPTLFLNESATLDLIEAESFDKLFDEYVARLPFLNPDINNDLVSSYAPVGSNILVRRSTCYHVGLFDEYFNSWGGEDREFVFRLLHHNTRVVRPQQFDVTKKWKIHRTNAYEGWRSLYRLHGDYARNLGLYQVHLFHPENSWKDPYGRIANFRYCDEKIAAICSGKVKTTPVKIDGSEKHAVFVGRNPTFFNDDVMELLGSVTIVDIDYALPADDFATRVLSHEPDRIFFQNVYQNDWMRDVWRSLKTKTSAQLFCVERGAFPSSIYFDPNGFCADSSSYDEVHWRNSKPVDAKSYFLSLKSENNALEPQGSASVDRIVERILPGRKNVLVLLQSLTDATTKYFTGNLGNYQEFLAVIEGLANSASDWNVLIKNHPLNKQNPLSCGVDVSDGNLYDLIELADVCVVLNSGAGLLALGAGKPVIAMGRCFYAQEGLAYSASDLSGLKDHIRTELKVDESAVNRFFGYLLNEFYSFATWTYAARDQSAKTKMSLMRNIRYGILRIGGEERHIDRGYLETSSLIFDPYALALYREKSNRVDASDGRQKEQTKLSGNSLKDGESRKLRPTKLARKFSKLTRNPHAFFADSSAGWLRPLRHLFR